MTKKPLVDSCPITRARQGVIHFPSRIIAELAGTVRAENDLEWLILLSGRVEQSGLEIFVDDFFVPDWQQRAPSTVDISQTEEFEVTVYKAGKPIKITGEAIVGVLHSHHTMGAFFSGTDKAQLNPNYKSSIVISSRLDTEESHWLGFAYQAEGQIKLPCGSWGLVPFKIDVLDCEDWPRPEIKAAKVEEVILPKDFGDCPHLQALPTTGFRETWQSACGVHCRTEVPRTAVFGMTTKIQKKLPPPVYPTSKYKGGYQGSHLEALVPKRYQAQTEVCNVCGQEDPLHLVGCPWGMEDTGWESYEKDKKGYGSVQLTAEEVSEWVDLDQLNYHEMTDAQFNRYIELDKKMWEEEHV